MTIVNFYAGLRLDRAAERRKDAAWIAERIADPRSRILPVWKLQNLVAHAPEPSPVALSPKAASAFADGFHFLGIEEETAYFTCDVSLRDPLEIAALANEGAFSDLRSVGPIMARDESALLAYARGLVHWHDRHRFCGACGASTRAAEAGHLRQCTNPLCNAPHFPRTDPAVIMLVVDGDRCLLGRQPGWMPGMHSTLAGFVEPGESLEEAVMREVFEETGVRTTDVRYHSSQPWPFPSSIMLGFTARATSTALTLNPGEIENAAWYSRDFLRAAHDPEIFRLPRVDSIARRLLEDWLAAG